MYFLKIFHHNNQFMYFKIAMESCNQITKEKISNLFAYGTHEILMMHFS